MAGRKFGLVWTAGLTLFAVAIAGYHPFAEDGGLYVAGIRKLLNPDLYPRWTEFVTEHLRFSLFAPMVAALVRLSHLRLEWILLLLFVASVWATLYGGWMLAARVTDSLHGRCGAVALLACWLTLPVAGTSLMLMDPYVTARNLSTPLLLIALAWAIDATSGERRAWIWCGIATMAALALHPLMTAYGLATMLMLYAVRRPSRASQIWGQSCLLGFALLIAAAIQWAAPAESSNYIEVALTRYYWFPAQWRWFEWLGLLAPLGLLHWLGSLQPRSSWRDLARTGTQVGFTAFLVAWLFARAGFSAHMVARMQPLRSFQMVYTLMILLFGAWLGERVLKEAAWRWVALLGALGGVMLYVQHQTYPHSAHLELPWLQPSNPWEQAFTWVRDNTPQDALFALDAHYITDGREQDAQGFRSIAERSALADYSKDGGEASIMPSLTDAWMQAQAAQNGLEKEPDEQREARLRPLGVSWVVLEAASVTAWHCPYRNAIVKVCRLP